MRLSRLLAPAAALLLAMTPAPSPAQTFEEAVAAYDRNDYVTAYRGFRRLAEQGDASAQYNLGLMYDNGEGVPQDHAEAVRWYRRAAEQGHAKAQYNLGLMYDKGEGVPQDYAEAARWYRRAAEQGNAKAQNNLGFMYDNGEGVSRDDGEAARWYRRAAVQGNASAQYNLGLMYDDGEGVPQDHAEAARWYRRAAEQGHAKAQYNLGLMYDKGEGVPQDYAEAARWYRRAAEQGNAKAQIGLGFVYWMGRGVPRDFVLAHKWFNLGASRSNDAAVRALAVRVRGRVASRMTAAQLARAQRLARLWRPRTETADTPAPPSDAGEPRNRVERVQRGLARLGYDPGPADGIPGARTRAAVRAFQAAAGLPPDGRVSERLAEAVAAALGRMKSAGLAPPPMKMAATGSGFRVSAGGHILTNAHVVRGCAEVRIPSPAATKRVRLAARDDAADLALLKGTGGAAFARFRQGRGVRPGAGVVVAGYPLHGLLSGGVKMSTGSVAALAGPGDDLRLMQISAPVQAGNSGGPVLDMAGNAVGVVVSKLDALKTVRATGDLPQNVNFAVSAGTARAFLDAEGVAYATAPSDRARAPEEVAAAARTFTVRIECWK